MSDEKLDKILESVGKLDTNIQLLQQELKTINERGCEASISEIQNLNIRLNKNEREHTFIKGITYAGSAIAGAIGWLIGQFRH